MINSFSGRYSFLSNFFVDSDGFCAEIEFQAMKATNESDKQYILDCYKLSAYKAPREAKRRGRIIVCRHDWERHLSCDEAHLQFQNAPPKEFFVGKVPFKVCAMYQTQVRKYTPLVMATMLKDTGNVPLIEGNWWHDVFWGVCTGEGRVKKCPGHTPYGDNWLGRSISTVRGGLN